MKPPISWTLRTDRERQIFTAGYNSGKVDEQLARAGHRCSGCGLRWEALPGAELCGDCWRKAQSVVLPVVPQQGPQQDELKVWRCFHCDEVFTDEAEARAHFGEDQTGTTAMGQAACTIAASDGGLLKALRESEREVGALRHQAEQLEYDAQAYEMTTAELTQRFGVGVRTAYQAWLKLEAMESRAMAAEEQFAVLSASRIDPSVWTAQDWWTLDRIEQYLTTMDAITVDDAHWLIEHLTKLAKAAAVVPERNQYGQLGATDDGPEPAVSSSSVADSPTFTPEQRAYLRKRLCECPVYMAAHRGIGGEETTFHGLAMKREDVSKLLDALPSASSASAAADKEQ